MSFSVYHEALSDGKNNELFDEQFAILLARSPHLAISVCAWLLHLRMFLINRLRLSMSLQSKRPPMSLIVDY